MHYDKKAAVSSSQLQNDFVSEKLQRTVLPPTKCTANNASSKQPVVAGEINVSTIQVSQLNALSEANHLQRLLWTMPQKCGKLSSSKSLDHRFVLPKAELDARDGQHRRTVILPEGKPKSQLVVTTEAALQLVSTTSKLSTSRQACEEELEFLKLKLRYMQNDIEFKQKQIDLSKPKGSSVSQQWNINNQHNPAGTNPAASISNNYYNPQQSHCYFRPTSGKAENWTASIAAEKQLKAQEPIAAYYSHLQQRNTSSSAVTVNYEPSISSRSNSFPIVAKSNNNPTLYTWSSNQKDGTHLRITSSSKVCSDNSGALSSHSDYAHVNRSNLVSYQHMNAAQNYSDVLGTQHTKYLAPSSPTSTNLFELKNTELSLSYPLSTAGSSPSAFDRLDNEGLSQSPQQGCVSPDKRFVLFPSKSVPVDVSFLEVTHKTYQTIPSAAAAQTFPVHKYHSGVEVNSNFPRLDTHLGTHSEKADSITASSKYKLVKNCPSLPASTAMTSSSSFSSTVPLPSHINSNILQEFPPYLIPIKPPTAVRRTSQSTRLSLHSPNLKIQTAAKLVSKYKLKRLSPTSASLAAPLFFQSKKPASIYKPENHFGLYNKHQHKLDRRQLSSGSTAPISLFKKPNIYSGLTKKHKIDRRPFFNQSLKTTRSPELVVARSKLKLDNRVPSSNALEKLGDERIQRVHTLDRRGRKCELHGLKVSPRLGNKHSWISSETASHPVGGGGSRIKRGESTYHWKIACPQQPETLRRTTPQNSRFKWSRPNVQSQNGAWQQLRQKLQLMLIKKHRHSRFKFYKSSPLTAAPNNYNGTPKAGDYKMNLVTIDGITYKSSRSKLTRTRRSSGNHSVKKAVSAQNSRPAGTPKSAHSTPLSARRSSASHLDLNIVNFANRAIHRSKVITAARYKKSNNKSKNETPHCIFFGRFGKCHRAGSCPFVHDPEQVAVCTRFLRGKCDTENCPFSHKASTNKMPVCLFFLRGTCFRENCPYLHVRVNPNAPICKDFRNGFCALGEKCTKIHSHVCPSFAMTGKCSRAGICTMLHRMNKRDTEQQSLQAKSLTRIARKQPQSEPRKFTRCPPPHISVTSIFTPTSTAALKTQPSFISLESNPMPSFISLETSHHGCSGESQVQVPCEQPGLSPGKVDLSVLEAGQGRSRDATQSIRPSFLAKKFTVDKTSEL